MTLEDYLKLTQPSLSQQLRFVWEGLCEDPKCPNNPSYGLKPGTTLRIKLPIEAWRKVE